MNDRERDDILVRLDERSERMDARIERMDARLVSQDEAIEDLDKRVTRNTTILAGITFGLSTFLTTAAGKVAAFLHIK